MARVTDLEDVLGDPPPDGRGKPGDGAAPGRRAVTAPRRRDGGTAGSRDGAVPRRLDAATEGRHGVGAARQHDATPPRRQDGPANEDEGPRKYTIRVSAAEDDRARAVVDDVVRRARIRPRKQMRADVIRALFLLAEDDAELRARVAAVLRDGLPS